MFTKTSALIRGTWDGVPDESKFTQNEGEYATKDDFVNDFANPDLSSLVNEYKISGDVFGEANYEMSADGKVLIFTRTFRDEVVWNIFKEDSGWATENAVTKLYDVVVAPTPEQIGTFNETERLYYHSVAHLS